MACPVPWSLAWSDDGELAAQDRFDLLQSLVCVETSEVQPSLIAAVERLSVTELGVLSSVDVTRSCA
ncbi:hypothetical protein [Synechococcus sp. CS-1328]|uniref:hypothetical protein n=1 Tax=Synechococcus sp. CS-1328 TaxID=2847976 RepID=UPI00223BB4AB|nr:hypothetical protein [Synechococcus sp. CS-1328]MCT0225665.1 hypothetical protein [Synechococcus sp. CS-1328]